MSCSIDHCPSHYYNTNNAILSGLVGIHTIHSQRATIQAPITTCIHPPHHPNSHAGQHLCTRNHVLHCEHHDHSYSDPTRHYASHSNQQNLDATKLTEIHTPGQTHLSSPPLIEPPLAMQTCHPLRPTTPTPFWSPRLTQCKKTKNKKIKMHHSFPKRPGTGTRLYWEKKNKSAERLIQTHKTTNGCSTTTWNRFSHTCPRAMLWNHLAQTDLLEAEWILVGDFNNIEQASDKQGAPTKLA